MPKKKRSSDAAGIKHERKDTARKLKRYSRDGNYEDLRDLLVDRRSTMIHSDIINSKDKYQWTALHYAANPGKDINIVKLLLEQKPNVDEVDPKGLTPLHHAVRFQKDADIPRLLLKNNAHVNAKDGDGWSALHYACSNEFNKDASIVKLLLAEARPDINAKDKDGDTALHSACSNETVGHIMVKYLLEKNVDIDIADIEGWTALHVACDRDNRKAARLLVESGADIHMKTKDQKTPLDMAQPDLVQELNDIIKCFSTSTSAASTSATNASTSNTNTSASNTKNNTENNADIDYKTPPPATAVSSSSNALHFIQGTSRLIPPSASSASTSQSSNKKQKTHIEHIHELAGFLGVTFEQTNLKAIEKVSILEKECGEERHDDDGGGGLGRRIKSLKDMYTGSKATLMSRVNDLATSVAIDFKDVSSSSSDLNLNQKVVLLEEQYFDKNQLASLNHKSRNLRDRVRCLEEAAFIE